MSASGTTAAAAAAAEIAGMTGREVVTTIGRVGLLSLLQKRAANLKGEEEEIGKRGLKAGTGMKREREKTTFDPPPPNTSFPLS